MCKCVREHSGEGSGRQRERSGTAAGEPAPDPPVGILYGILIILLLEPFSELAITEIHEQFEEQSKRSRSRKETIK